MKKKVGFKNILFYSFLVIYSVALIYLAAKLNIWEDEAYSMHTTSNNLARVISQSYTFEGQPPFYFVLLAIWRHISPGIFFARFLSLICIGLSGIFFYKIIRLIYNAEFPKWMLIIYLMNPFTIWAALEIRLYALVILLSCILLYCFFQFFFNNHKKYLYPLLFISLVGLYTQYFFSFEVAAMAMALLLFKGWKSFFTFCIYFIPVIILFIPNLFFLMQQVSMIQVEGTVSSQISSVIHSPQALALGLEISPVNIWVNRLSRIIVVTLLLLAYYKLYKRQNKSAKEILKKVNLVVLVTGIIFLLYVICIAALKMGFEPRYIVLTLPLFMLFYITFKAYNAIATKIIFFGLLSFYAFEFYLNYKVPIKTYAYRRTSQVVHQIVKPHEPILLYSKILLPAFSFYYTGPDSVYSLPKYKFDEKYYDENITDTSQLKQAIKNIPTQTHTYLLINNPIKGFKDPIKMNDSTFNQCLNSNFKITLDTTVIGESQRYSLRIRRIQPIKQ